MNLIVLVVVMCGFGMGCQTEVGERYSVYVSHGDKISQFDMDSETGELTEAGAVGGVVVGAQTGSIAVRPGRRVMYVSVRGENRIAALSIDGADGSLSVINQIDAEAKAAYVTVDQTGQWLLSAYYGDNFVAVHRLNDDGSIDENRVQRFDTEVHPHCIRLSDSNASVLVPNTGSHFVMQFLFDEKTGRLIPNDPLKAPSDEGVIGPRHIWFHPTGNFAYTSNEQGRSVTAYRYDGMKGTVERFQTLSTVPEGFDAKGSCADIEVSPDGKFVFVSNRGHNSIARFSVDEVSGKLTSLGQTLTEDTPRSFNVDPTGRFMYVAGQKSGKLAGYRIDGESGELVEIGKYEVEDNPSWVEVVKGR